MENDVRKAIRYLKSNGMPASVTVSHLISLRSGTWISDEVITHLCTLTEKAVHNYNDKVKAEDTNFMHQVLIFDSMFFPALFNQGHSDRELCDKYTFSRTIQRILKKKTRYERGIEDGDKEERYHPPDFYDKIIFVNNARGIHWNVVCIFPKNQIIEGYDSMGTFDEYFLKSMYRLIKDWSYAEWHREKGMGVQWSANKWKLWRERRNLLYQKDGYNCGIFALQYLYLLGTNQKLTKVSPAQANLHRQRYLLHFLQHSCLPDLKEYVKGLPKNAMSPSMDVAYTQIQPIQHDGNSVDYAQLLIDNLSKLVNEKNYLSPCERWVLENQDSFVDWLIHVNKIFGHDEVSWIDAIYNEGGWFDRNNIKPILEAFPKPSASLSEVMFSLENGTFFQLVCGVDFGEKKKNKKKTERIQFGHVSVPKGRKLSKKQQAAEKKNSELDKALKTYPYENVFEYQSFDTKKQREFDQMMTFQILTDTQEDKRKELLDKFPEPPKFYQPIRDKTIEEELIGDKFHLLSYIPREKFEEHRNCYEKVTHTESGAQARKQIERWKVRFRQWLNDRVALEKTLEKEFNKEIHETYSHELAEHKEASKTLKRLLKKHDDKDTRVNTELGKFLSKQFPRRWNVEYTKEEALRLEVYKKRILSKEQREEMDRMTRHVDQISQLQYFPAKTKTVFDKKGTTEWKESSPAYFKGRVMKYGVWVDVKEPYSEIWAAQNFHPTFLALVKQMKGEWVPIPPGLSTDEKAPKLLRSKIRNAHRQWDDDTCMISSFACALDYISKKPNHDFIAGAAIELATHAKEYETKGFKECLKFIADVMRKFAPAICTYSTYNVHRRRRPVKPMLMSNLTDWRTPFPTLVEPVGVDGSKSHVITVVDDLIFDSTQKYALKLCQQSLDWVCGDSGCSAIGRTIRFDRPLNSKHEFTFGKIAIENWGKEKEE